MIKKVISTAILTSAIGSVSANPELGYMTLNTEQHQFFSATITIDALPTELAGKKLKVKLGSVTDFYRHNIEYNKQVSSLRFKVAKDNDGQPLIRVRSIREITASQLKAVVKLTVGKEQIYGIYDFQLAPDKERHITVNLLNADHKPVEKPVITQSSQKPKPTSVNVNSATIYEHNIRDISTPSDNVYRVKAGQSLSRIAMELIPRYPEMTSWRTLMKKLALLNPEAFINGDINRLRAEAKLKLPGFPRQTEGSPIPAAKGAGTVAMESPANGSMISTNQQGNSPDREIIITDLPSALAGKENLNITLGSITDFYRQGVDYNQQVAGLRFDITGNSSRKTVVRVYSDRAINTGELTAVVRLSVGREKVYGIYELRSGNATFNLLDTKNRKKPQQVKSITRSDRSSDHGNTSSARITDPTAKQQALAALRSQIKEYEKAQKLDRASTQSQPSIQREREPASVASGDRYQISRGDTLGTIAARLTKTYPKAKSWRAMMKLLVSQNPDAFINGDIDKIRAGTWLTLPDNSHFDRLYEVSWGENISTIAWNLQKKYRHSGGWRGMMHKLIRMNPEAFINGNPHMLREKAYLLIPEAGQPWLKSGIQESSIDQWNSTNNQTVSLPADHQMQVAKNHLPAKASLQYRNSPAKTSSLPEAHNGEHTGQTEHSADNLAATSYNKISKSLLSRAQNGPSYTVPDGYTISMVAIKLFPGFPQYKSWPALMDALYKLNPDAFIDNDINRLNSGARLKLPRTTPT